MTLDKRYTYNFLKRNFGKVKREKRMEKILQLIVKFSKQYIFGLLDQIY